MGEEEVRAVELFLRWLEHSDLLVVSYMPRSAGAVDHEYTADELLTMYVEGQVLR